MSHEVSFRMCDEQEMLYIETRDIDEFISVFDAPFWDDNTVLETSIHRDYIEINLEYVLEWFGVEGEELDSIKKIVKGKSC